MQLTMFGRAEERKAALLTLTRRRATLARQLASRHPREEVQALWALAHRAVEMAIRALRAGNTLEGERLREYARAAASGVAALEPAHADELVGVCVLERGR